ncbi:MULTISPECIES: hypothetical protein [Bacillaceae]|jgi:hypothetical protein|uniref:hypothetical protein n=1 Tax=Bacillaceae TaxID=186817 RepID=UPI00101C50E4|nr:hypothetical protein [Ectobacillus funiculus]
MTKWTIKLTILEVIVGVLFMLYELFTGHPWTMDGIPWTMDENFHFNVALGCFTGAGFTFIFGAILGSIQHRDYSYKE